MPLSGLKTLPGAACSVVAAGLLIPRRHQSTCRRSTPHPRQAPCMTRAIHSLRAMSSLRTIPAPPLHPARRRQAPDFSGPPSTPAPSLRKIAPSAAAPRQATIPDRRAPIDIGAKSSKSLRQAPPSRFAPPTVPDEALKIVGRPVATGSTAPSFTGRPRRQRTPPPDPPNRILPRASPTRPAKPDPREKRRSRTPRRPPPTDLARPSSRSAFPAGRPLFSKPPSPGTRRARRIDVNRNRAETRSKERPTQTPPRSPPRRRRPAPQRFRK